MLSPFWDETNALFESFERLSNAFTRAINSKGLNGLMRMNHQRPLSDHKFYPCLLLLHLTLKWDGLIELTDFTTHQDSVFFRHHDIRESNK